MINLSRRGFLVSSLALAAVTASPVAMALSGRPQLWADGVHDDGPALQWLIDEAARTGRPFVMENGYFNTRQMLHLRGPVSWRWNNFISDNDEIEHIMDTADFIKNGSGEISYNIFSSSSFLKEMREMRAAPIGPGSGGS